MTSLKMVSGGKYDTQTSSRGKCQGQCCFNSSGEVIEIYDDPRKLGSVTRYSEKIFCYNFTIIKDSLETIEWLTSGRIFLSQKICTIN